MTVNSHLNSIASNCVLRALGRTSIDRSVDFIQSRIATYFKDDIVEQIVFGSYSRETILPRNYDANADVDLMVVFKDSKYKPQTYLDRLRRFAETHYASSEIKQSHPTVQLHLNHIRFELVPAVRGNILYSEHYIPSPDSQWSDWMGTNPRAFNRKLIRVNQANANLTKPLIRVLKCWNAQHGYPFASFDLERHIVENSPTGWGRPERLDSYFFEIVGTLPSFLFGPQWKRDKVLRLNLAVRSARERSRSSQFLAARIEIQRVLKAA
jgi:hypothetical protein